MGLVAAMGMTDNMMLRGYKKGIPFFTDRRTPKAMAEQLIKELEIVTPGVSTPVGRLSGGNVQKVLVGREISSNPRVLMVAYPVRGLDINFSYTIYHLLNEQKKQGAAVICVGGRPGCAPGALRPHSGALRRQGQRYCRWKNSYKRRDRTYDDKDRRRTG